MEVTLEKKRQGTAVASVIICLFVQGIIKSLGLKNGKKNYELCYNLPSSVVMIKLNLRMEKVKEKLRYAL